VLNIPKSGKETDSDKANSSVSCHSKLLTVVEAEFSPLVLKMKACHAERICKTYILCGYKEEDIKCSIKYPNL